MHKYKMTNENNEGIQWYIELEHKEKFSREEFRDICEAALVYALEKEYKKEKQVFIYCLDNDYVKEYLFSKGFSEIKQNVTCYWFDVFDIQSFKNEKLIQWCTTSKNLSENEKSEYLKDIEL